MFKGKIYKYSNINGKEEKFEREFNDINEYNSFMSENPNLLWFWTSNSDLAFNSFFDFNNYLDNFFDTKLALSSSNEQKQLNWTTDNVEWVDLSKYENELQKIESEKKKKQEEKGVLEKSLEKLKEYLEKFKKEWKEDFVKNIKEDIKKIEEKLKNLVK